MVNMTDALCIIVIITVIIIIITAKLFYLHVPYLYDTME